MACCAIGRGLFWALMGCGLVVVTATTSKDDDLHYGTFPDNFIWGSATSSYQIEGAWEADEKGESIWDRFSHTPGKITDNSTGDDACKSYEKYREDVKILKEMGVSHYRFSIAWPRIQPTGEETTANALGVAYYNKLIDALLAEGIKPMGTLYHWDLPQALEDKGGWLNETTIVPAFAHYSRLCFEAFGDRVKTWITLNEPWVIVWLGYGVGAKAPGIQDPGVGVYVAGHNQIKAHAESYHVYDTEFRAEQKGIIGITLNGAWREPKTQSAADLAASERALQFDFGWFANPVFIDGDYPPIMKETVANKSAAQGLSASRLPEFTDAEKLRNNGTSDFFGLNFYSASLTFHQEQPLLPPSYGSDRDVGEEADPSWPGSGSGWLKVTPFGIRKMLVWIKDTYGNPPSLITENGVSDRNGSLHDEHRITYYRGYINNVLKAIDLDSCNVIGYTAWSLLDNFEWEMGYVERFGLHYVNYSDPERPRTAKDSARYFAQIIADNGFPQPQPSLSAPTSLAGLVALGTLILWAIMMF